MINQIIKICLSLLLFTNSFVVRAQSNKVVTPLNSRDINLLKSILEEEDIAKNIGVLNYYARLHPEFFINKKTFPVFYYRIYEGLKQHPEFGKDIIPYILDTKNQKLNSFVKGRLLELKAFYEYDLHEYENAEKDFNEAISLIKSKVDIQEIQKMKFSLADCYFHLGNLDKSGFIYDELLNLKYGQLTRDTKGSIYNNKAMVYYNIGLLDKAEYNSKLSLNYLPKEKLKFSYYTLANIYFMQGKKDKVVHYVEKIKKTSLNSDIDLEQLYEFLGFIDLQNNDFDSALKHYLIAESHADNLNDDWLKISVLKRLGEVYINLNEKKNAIKTLSKAYALASKNKFASMEKELSLLLSTVFESNSDFKKAYSYLKISMKMADSLFSNDITKLILERDQNKALAFKQFQIETLEKDKELSKKDLKIKEVNIQKVKNFNFYLVIELTLLGALIVILLLYFRSRIKRNIQKIKNLENEKKIIKLNEQLIGQEIEKNRIAKELHDGVGNDLIVLEREMPSEFSSKIRDLYFEIRNLSHELNAPIIDESTSLKSLIEELIFKNLVSAEIKCTFNWYPKDAKIELNEKQQMSLYRIIQELFSNIVKHSKATMMELNITIFDNDINVLISDNGVGFSKANGSSKKGIGMDNIKSRVEALNGKLNIDSNEYSGTTITIEIPCEVSSLIN